ncbi:hypothetical protein NKR23_g251 [Pleurostoma richardsiae]|uniref:Zn(2)-C6 fungal-type domain-containing protein n=1 Tax=Pleurostoma richardsiae TaxID=41990 RepID=A0AA38S1Y1_9PEZI|nr:hypothetical protein NKR23_g251 [Pleurostoma richardsiae]
MVYRGKPSAACEPCRRKRRKCDLSRPGCSQCARARIACPGYRDLSGLEIRNQTSEVVQKMSGPSSSGSGSEAIVSSSDQGLRDSYATSSTSTLVSSVPSAVSTPLYDVALSYFLTAHAPSGRFSYLPDHVSPHTLPVSPGASGAPDASSPLPHALLACSLATLSQSPDHSYQSVLPDAYKSYSTAVKSVNHALSSPSTAALDSTLLSVLLLGLFETAIHRGHATPLSLTTHIEGSFALLKLRGPEQCQTDLGRDLYLQAADNIRTNYALRGMRPPRELEEIQARAVENNWLGRDQNIYVGISAMIRRMIAWRQEIGARGDFISPLARGMVLEGLELDDGVAEMLRDIAKFCQRRESESPGGAETFASSTAPETALDLRSLINTKFDSHIARYWITFQTWRLMLNGWSFQCLVESRSCPCRGDRDGPGADAGDHSKCLTPEQEKTSLQLIATRGYEASKELLDHMPYFIESVTEPRRKPFLRYLLFPLVCVALTPFGPPGPKSNRTLSLFYLREMARRFNYEKAEKAARMIEEKNTIEDWIHMQTLS